MFSGVNEIKKPAPKIATIKNNFINFIIFVFKLFNKQGFDMQATYYQRPFDLLLPVEL